MNEVAIARSLPLRFRTYNMGGVSRDGTFSIVHEYVAKLGDNLKKGIGLILTGASGTGKTGALAAVFNEVARQFPRYGSKDRMWCSARDIAYMFGYGKTDATFDEPVDDLYTEAKFLVIDELGRESDVKNHERRMHHLLSQRHNGMKVTCFTSNLSVEELQPIYGEGFVSILHKVCIIAEVSGPDRRRPTT